MKSMNAPPGPLPSRWRSQLDPEALAVQCLTFLAGDDERLGRFFALTGLDPASLRSAAADRSLTNAVLAYLGNDESLLVAFAAEVELDPEKVGLAIRAATETHDPDFF